MARKKPEPPNQPVNTPTSKPAKPLTPPVNPGAPNSLYLGADGVERTPDTKGRVSRLFPTINISATARKLNVTKSHLSKVLHGTHKPSMELAVGIANAIGCDLYWVASRYKIRQAADRQAANRQAATSRQSNTKKKARSK